jgi:hypothetical protein
MILFNILILLSKNNVILIMQYNISKKYIKKIYQKNISKKYIINKETKFLFFSFFSFVSFLWLRMNYLIINPKGFYHIKMFKMGHVSH